MEKTIHQGRNIRRFREMLGIKQEALAIEMGEDWSQRKVSLLEQKEQIDSSVLDLVAKTLKIPKEAILNFDEDTAILNIQNNYEGSNSGSGTIGNNLNYSNCTFNTIEKIVELYEALLKSEREKKELMERVLDRFASIQK